MSRLQIRVLARAPAAAQAQNQAEVRAANPAEARSRILNLGQILFRGRIQRRNLSRELARDVLLGLSPGRGRSRNRRSRILRKVRRRERKVISAFRLITEFMRWFYSGF